jgi:hypothetical protein
MRNTWLDLTLDSIALAAEAQSVMALRMMKLAAGGAAAASEAQLMVTEKVQAAAEVQMQLATSMLTGSAHMAPKRAVAHYRRKVRANRRRLSR